MANNKFQPGDIVKVVRLPPDFPNQQIIGLLGVVRHRYYDGPYGRHNNVGMLGVDGLGNVNPWGCFLDEELELIDPRPEEWG